MYNYSNKAKHNMKSFFRILLLICLLFFQNLNGMPLSDPSMSSSDENPLLLLNNLKSNQRQMTQEDEALVSPFNLNDDNNNKINSKNENFLQNLNNILAAELNEDDKKKTPSITSNNNNQLPLSSNNNMEEEESDAYFKYIKSSSASNLNRNQHHRQMMKTQKKSSSSSFKFNGHHPSPLSNMSNRKIFRVDKNLQRLEKKSWKIPIKTVALYKNVENQSPQKMVGELNELFDSFKNS